MPDGMDWHPPYAVIHISEHEHRHPVTRETVALQRSESEPDDNEGFPGNQRRYRHGGLMRCCLETLATNTKGSVVGSTLQCKYATDDPLHRMRVADDGVWEWDH